MGTVKVNICLLFPFIFRENELWVKPWLFFKKKYKTEKIKVEKL